MHALGREVTGVGLSGITLLMQLIFMLLGLRDSMFVRESVSNSWQTPFKQLPLM